MASITNDTIARAPITVSITERIRLSLLFILAHVLIVDYLEPRHIFYAVYFVFCAYLGEGDSIGYKILVLRGKIPLVPLFLDDGYYVFDLAQCGLAGAAPVKAKVFLACGISPYFDALCVDKKLVRSALVLGDKLADML